MSEASKLVSSAIIGADHVVVVIAQKCYFILPPTIHKIAGAAFYLSDFGEGESLHDILASINDVMKLSNALSFFIKGDNSLAEDLAEGTFEEIVNALEAAYSLISTKNFLKLSALARSVASLTAKPRL